MIGAALAAMLGFAIAACERAVEQEPAAEKPSEPAPVTEMALNDEIWLTDENRVKTDMPVGVVASSKASEAEEAEASFAITWTVTGNLKANTVDVYLGDGAPSRQADRSDDRSGSGYVWVYQGFRRRYVGGR